MKNDNYKGMDNFTTCFMLILIFFGIILIIYGITFPDHTQLDTCKSKCQKYGLKFDTLQSNYPRNQCYCLKDNLPFQVPF